MRLELIGLSWFSSVAAIFFVFFSSCVGSLFSFWVYLELAGLSLLPSFFVSSASMVGGVYGGLLLYILVSGLSSVFFVTGFIFEGLYVFILVGFLVKLGLFPFMVWVYRVFPSGGWVFIFLLSVVLKFPVLYFGYIFGGVYGGLVYLSCIVTILICSLIFWLVNNDWKFIWAHMSLSSVATLMVVCYSGDFSSCWVVFFSYCVWSGLCLLFFFVYQFGVTRSWAIWVFFFLFLVTPLSLPLAYKLSACVAFFYSSVYVLVAWSVYSFSEQFFLYKLCADQTSVGVLNVWFS
uniref:NADH dehydrogenase subunit 2 n=1 Tax=Breviscolex orientalis TaxID=137570 RepID=A0A343ESQ8_9CEST|nr:NADH dehydrogenase subunit 2 [Breviscolex orientalis]ASL24594.1 NADH dehydrogenase subunit 2 [Breviscolex orientalis]